MLRLKAKTQVRKGPDLLRKLLEKGAEVNAKDNDGRTALIWASSAMDKNDLNPSALEALMTNGADVNAKDNRGQTALMRLVAPLAHQAVMAGDRLHTCGNL